MDLRIRSMKSNSFVLRRLSDDANWEIFQETCACPFCRAACRVPGPVQLASELQENGFQHLHSQLARMPFLLLHKTDLRSKKYSWTFKFLITTHVQAAGDFRRLYEPETAGFRRLKLDIVNSGEKHSVTPVAHVLA